MFGSSVDYDTLQKLLVWHEVYSCHRSPTVQVVDGVRQAQREASTVGSHLIGVRLLGDA